LPPTSKIGNPAENTLLPDIAESDRRAAVQGILARVGF
jgi:hypothetical protein